MIIIGMQDTILPEKLHKFERKCQFTNFLAKALRFNDPDEEITEEKRG